MGAQASFVMTSAQASNPVLGYRFVFHNNFLAMAHGYVVYQGRRQGGLRVSAHPSKKIVVNVFVIFCADGQTFNDSADPARIGTRVIASVRIGIEKVIDR